MKRLDEADIERRLAGGPWTRAGEAMTRTWRLGDFAAALAFVDRIGEAAERANHHPDMTLHDFNRVTVTLSTHSAGGLTEADFGLAAAIDRLA